MCAMKNTYFELVLIRLMRPKDVWVEFRMSTPGVYGEAGGRTVIGNDDGSLMMVSIESGSSSITPGRIKSFSIFSLWRSMTSSLGDGKVRFENLKKKKE